jgi:arylsulfatase A-like enzyme
MPSDPATSTRADYVAMVERVDRGVGEVLRALDRRGVATNTIVIFTNDNGGEWLADTAPVDARLEGINLLPILDGRMPEMERTLFWRTATGNRSQKAVRRGDWKLVIDGTHTFVFNVRTDISERQDLASRRQDIARNCSRCLPTGNGM